MKKQDQNRKKRVFQIIQIDNTDDTASIAFDILIVITILANITMMFLETYSELARWVPLFHVIEQITLVIFIVEYALRLWTSDLLFPGVSKRTALRKFMTSFDGIIELLTILPFLYLSGFVAFRMLRVVRIFHLFRINSNYDSFNVITTILKQKKNQLMSSLFIIFVLMLSASLFMYSAEHEAQPEAFRNAFSGIWWSMSTLLTVGYGDIYPITTVGKIFAIIIAFLGVGAVAVPTGIISAGFVEQYTQMQNGGQSNGSDVVTITIDIDSSWIGMTREEIEEKYNAVILLVHRGQARMKPSHSYKVHLGDILSVYMKVI